MSRLAAKTTGLLLRLFAKPHLVAFLLIFTNSILTNKPIFYTPLFQFFKIYSSMENFHREVEHLRSIFKCNNYLAIITDQCTKKFLDKLYVSKQSKPTVPKKQLIIVIPFLGKCSTNLRTRSYKSVGKT